MAALIEPFFYCLFASIVWAPLVFFGAHRLCADDDRTPGAPGSLSGKVWPAALLLAALPVAAAPIAAALGLSLRAPAPLPPMAALSGGEVVEASASSAPAALYAATNVTLADILRTIAGLYFYGFLMLCALVLVRHIWFAYRLNFAMPLDEPKLEMKLEDWRKRIGVARKPRYVFSHIVTSVCVYGVFRPIIVMPFNLLERVSIDDAALMGAHEMAHVRRGDVVQFALCAIVKAVFWFNPFMHRICARANLAAEQGADAMVLARGVDRRQYAHCFVQGLRLAAGEPRNRFTGELVPSFTPFDKRSRRARLDAILSGAGHANGLGLGSKLSMGVFALIAAGLAFAQAAFAVAPPPATSVLPVAPVEGEVGFGFGKKSELLGPDRAAHEGVDIRAPRGEPVRAAGGGKVIDATKHYRGGAAWGNVVVIDHGHGLVTRYAHLDNYVVRKGDRVAAGDIIGAVGSTGKATGPHLHFEVIENGAHVDPALVLAVAPRPVDAIQAAPRIKAARNVPIAPMPRAAPAAAEPAIDVDAAPDVNINISGKHTRKLDDRLAKLEGRLRARFENFNAFSDLDDVVIRINDLELEGFENAEAISEMLNGRELDLGDLADMEFSAPNSWSFGFRSGLSEEQREEMVRASKEARKEAAKAIKQARKDIQRAKRQSDSARRNAFAKLSQEDRERALEEAERERERALEEAEEARERAFERIERDIERAERARERAERDRERAERRAERAMSEKEILDYQENAIREAKATLERELEQIEKRKRALARSE
ncbi:M23/M56 family metallopeptidase [Hyphococcus sp.]|uniref:M23/M56 family metallopeptidase n=1 Tax=Hyphococcus sp. TaxID=2038636 RepID=UPI003CCC3452